MITLTWFEGNDEITASFPSHNQVCDRCEGFGTHLNPSIGEHAYTMEEFQEEFDEEEQEEYFKRGGIYDVRCEECHGNKVVNVVDKSKLTIEDEKLYNAYLNYRDEVEREEAEDRATRRAEEGRYGDW